MGSPIFQAPPYRPQRERRRRIIIAAAVAIALTAGFLAYAYRNLPYERVVESFFAALQDKDYEGAYGIWMADPDWKQHPQRYNQYPFSDFYRDWGPGGEYGIIRSFDVEGSASPGGSGVVVVVQVNERVQRAHIWVEKEDKTLTFSPFETVR